jgi:hypothetical protein
MLRSALHLLLVIIVAISMGACSRTPSLRVEAHPLDGTRPPQWVLRCQARRLKEPVKYQWRFPAGVKQIGWGVPQDEPTELVQPPETQAAWGECTATGADGVVVRASHSMMPASVSAAPAAAKVGELIVVRGAGFGPSPSGEDGIWLVPPWGAAIRADDCKGASWGDAAVSACVPKAARGKSWLVRVQSNETLVSAPKPLAVAP